MEETVLSMNHSKNFLWMLDSIFLNAQSLKLADKLDALFFFEQTDVEQIKVLNKQAFFLPAAFDDRIFKDLSQKKDIDILFIGTLYEERVRLLDRLKEKFPQLNIKVYCWRYRFYKTPVKYLMSLWDRFYINRFVTLKQANKLYNRSKICLNMHHGQSIYGVNPRFFEISGANALQFVEDKPFIKDYFPNYNIPVYKSEEELFSMIAQYFSTESKESKESKESMDSPQQDFRALYNDLLANHTYKMRINTILSKI